MNTTKPIYHIDASQLKNSNCFRRLYLTIVKGYTKPNFDIKMYYGTCFHKFLELYHTGVDTELAKQTAIDLYNKDELVANATTDSTEFRTISHFTQSINRYIQTYKYKQDGVVPILHPATNQPISEQTFSVPWYEDENFALCISGIIDLPCYYHGQLSIMDHKTTSSSQKPNMYFQQFKRAIQTKLYTWIDKVYNRRENYLPVVINGIFIKTWTKKAREAGQFDGVSLERSSLFEYNDEEMAEFDMWLRNTLNCVTEQIKLNLGFDKKLPRNINLACCVEFPNLCPFFQVCAAPPEFMENILADSFKSRHYNPATFHE